MNKQNFHKSDIQIEKQLRQDICKVFVRNKQQHIRHELLESWGYGSSLRALKKEKLLEVYEIAAGEPHFYQRFRPFKPKKPLSNKAKRIYALSQNQGWSSKKLRDFMKKHYKKGSLQDLSESELNGMLAMFNEYNKIGEKING